MVQPHISEFEFLVVKSRICLFFFKAPQVMHTNSKYETLNSIAHCWDLVSLGVWVLLVLRNKGRQRGCMDRVGMFCHSFLSQRTRSSRPKSPFYAPLSNESPSM